MLEYYGEDNENEAMESKTGDSSNEPFTFMSLANWISPKESIVKNEEPKKRKRRSLLNTKLIEKEMQRLQVR